MPWKCPSCSEQIQHRPDENAPMRGVVYRCHICRLELTPDAPSGKLAVASLPADAIQDTTADRPARRYPRSKC